MATIQGQTFENKEIDLSANQYEDCIFRRCKLDFSGGAYPVKCDFIDCGIGFSGPALDTLSFVSSLYRSGEFGKGFVESLFHALRAGGPIPPVPV